MTDRDISATDGEKNDCDYPGCTEEAKHNQEMADGTPRYRCDTHKLATNLLPPF